LWCKNKCPFEDIVEMGKFSKMVVLANSDSGSQSLAPTLEFLFICRVEKKIQKNLFLLVKNIVGALS
jgi:hypothetical protein